MFWRVDLTGVSPLIRPRDTVAADLVIISMLVSVDILVDDADLLSVAFEVDPVVVVERRDVPVAILAAHLA